MIIIIIIFIFKTILQKVYFWNQSQLVFKQLRSSLEKNGEKVLHFRLQFFSFFIYSFLNDMDNSFMTLSLPVYLPNIDLWTLC